MAHCSRYVPSVNQSSFFLRFARDNTSQGGEDGIIEAIFERISLADAPVGTGRKRKPRVCCEVGSWDGKWLSNTYSLLTGAASSPAGHPDTPATWTGVLIEADEQRSSQCQSMYAALAERTRTEGQEGFAIPLCMCEMVGVTDTETSTSLTTLLNKANGSIDIESGQQRDMDVCPKDLDLLSIDIDGNDFHVWASLLNTGVYRPKLVVIEFNPSIPHSTSFVQPPLEAVQQGSSLRALVEKLGLENGYMPICVTAFNCFFLSVDVLFSQRLEKEVRNGVPEGEEGGEGERNGDMAFQDYLNFCSTDEKILMNYAASKSKSLDGTHVPFPTAPFPTAVSSAPLGDTITAVLGRLHAPSMVTELFQTYEGELCLVGPRKLLWHRLAINPQKIQVLSKSQRKFPFAPTATAANASSVMKGSLPKDSKPNSSKYGITRGRQQDEMDQRIAELTSRVCSSLDKSSTRNDNAAAGDGGGDSDYDAAKATVMGQIDCLLDLFDENMKPKSGADIPPTILSLLSSFERQSELEKSDITEKDKDFAINISTQILDLLADSLPIQRYEDTSMILGVSCLMYLQAQCKTDCRQESVENFDVYKKKLSTIFTAQADTVIEMDAESASVWLRRAEIVSSASSENSSSRSLSSQTPTSSSSSSSSSSTDEVEVLKRQCRCSRLTGDILGWWHYIGQLNHAGCSVDAEREWKRLRKELSDRSLQGSVRK